VQAERRELPEVDLHGFAFEHLVCRSTIDAYFY
jgi:hypothetical protein